MRPAITVAETASMWCPLMSITCVGEKCMAWRWQGLRPRRFWPHDVYEQEEQPPRPADVPATWVWQARSVVDAADPPGWLEPEAEAMLRWRGYCGAVARQ